VAGAVIAVLAVLVASVALACLARSAPHAEPFVSPAEPHARHPEPFAPPAEPRAPREQHLGTPRPRSLGPHAVPLARAAGTQDPRAAPEGVTISPSLAIRLRAGRRMLPAHSRDDRP
jgi:hypothetical protein